MGTFSVNEKVTSLRFQYCWQVAFGVENLFIQYTPQLRSRSLFFSLFSFFLFFSSLASSSVDKALGKSVRACATTRWSSLKGDSLKSDKIITRFTLFLSNLFLYIFFSYIVVKNCGFCVFSPVIDSIFKLGKLDCLFFSFFVSENSIIWNKIFIILNIDYISKRLII